MKQKILEVLNSYAWDLDIPDMDEKDLNTLKVRLSSISGFCNDLLNYLDDMISLEDYRTLTFHLTEFNDLACFKLIQKYGKKSFKEINIKRLKKDGSVAYTLKHINCQMSVAESKMLMHFNGNNNIDEGLVLVIRFEKASLQS